MKYGLSPGFRRALHERPLSGNGPNFANSAICALLLLALNAAKVRNPPSVQADVRQFNFDPLGSATNQNVVCVGSATE